jgi:hypothetical protein
VVCRRHNGSIMRIGVGILVGASILNSCFALTLLRPNPRVRCTMHGVHGIKCMRLSGGGGSGIVHVEAKNKESNAVHCLFRIKVPHTMPGDTVKIAGGADSIGNWQKDRALNLTTSERDFPWSDSLH